MKIKKLLIWSVPIFLCLSAIYNLYPETELPSNTVVDSLVAYKSENKLLAYSQGKLVRTYQISLGANPAGHKQFEGDEKTPEGLYTINNKNPNSGYHKNLGISYPNATDLAHAKALGKAAGGDIKIHGLRNKIGFIGKFQRLFNWTNGCMAVTNQEIDELYTSVKLGAPINIKP